MPGILLFVNCMRSTSCQSISYFFPVWVLLRNCSSWSWFSWHHVTTKEWWWGLVGSVHVCYSSCYPTSRTVDLLTRHIMFHTSLLFLILWQDSSPSADWVWSVCTLWQWYGYRPSCCKGRSAFTQNVCIWRPNRQTPALRLRRNFRSILSWSLISCTPHSIEANVPMSRIRSRSTLPNTLLLVWRPMVTQRQYSSPAAGAFLSQIP